MSKPKLPSLCAECPAKAGESWRKRAALIRRELRRNHLVERERLVAEVILDMTLGWQRESIAIPHLKLFTDLTGIADNHVTEVLSELHGARVIRVVTVKGLATYSIREDADPDGISPFAWKLRPRIPVSAMTRSVDLVRELNGLPPLAGPFQGIPDFFEPQTTAKIAASDTPKRGTPGVTPANGRLSDYLPNLF